MREGISLDFMLIFIFMNQSLVLMCTSLRETGPVAKVGDCLSYGSPAVFELQHRRGWW
jgi:hypothetical protein